MYALIAKFSLLWKSLLASRRLPRNLQVFHSGSSFRSMLKFPALDSFTSSLLSLRRKHEIIPHSNKETHREALRQTRNHAGARVNVHIRTDNLPSKGLYLKDEFEGKRKLKFN